MLKVVNSQMEVSETFEQVYDGQSQHIAGLWRSKGVYYVQLPSGGGEDPLRVALHGICNEAEAVDALKKLQLKLEQLSFSANP